MKYDEAIRILGNVSLDYTGMNQEEIDQMDEALTLAFKALKILDDVNHKLYRNESCDRAGKCDDYIGWHCTGCRGNTTIKAGFISLSHLADSMRPLRMHSRRCQSRHREDGRLSMSPRSAYLN